MGNGAKMVKSLCITAAMIAILEVSKHLLDALPNIELVTFLTIVFTLHFGLKKTAAAVFVFAIVEMLIYGFGLWVISYLYIWPLLALVTWMMRKAEPWFWFVILAGVFGLLFGALCAIVNLIVGGWHAALAWWIAGIPFDLIHGAANALVMAVLYLPVTKALKRIV